MKYDYTCDSCLITFEVKSGMKDMPVSAICPQCDKPARRVFHLLNVTWGSGCWQFGKDGLGDEPCHNW